MDPSNPYPVQPSCPSGLSIANPNGQHLPTSMLASTESHLSVNGDGKSADVNGKHVIVGLFSKLGDYPLPLLESRLPEFHPRLLRPKLPYISQNKRCDLLIPLPNFYDLLVPLPNLLHPNQKMRMQMEKTKDQAVGVLLLHQEHMYV